MGDANSPAFSGPELCKLSAVEAVTALESGAVSALELVEASLTRITQCSPDINATVTVCTEKAKDAARQADRHSVLAGLPVGIKDLNPVAGVRTSWGNTALANHIPTSSDFIVTRIQDSGGTVIGKTNTPEMGAGANTFNDVFGMTRNPWDTRLNAGGSSGGAAASLAVGETWLSQGSDLGGSLRTPASFCGIVGLRPSPGRVPNGPGAQPFDMLSVQGPMARSVADCALFLDAMSGFVPSDPLSNPADSHACLDVCQQESGPVRLGVSFDLNGQCPVDNDITQALRGGLARLAGTQIDVVEDQPHIAGLDECFRSLRAFGFRTLAAVTPEAVKAAYKPALQQNIADGMSLNVEDLVQATLTRGRLYAAMMQYFTKFDVLACPVTGCLPLPVEIEYPRDVAGIASRDYIDWLRFAFLATLCGLPALSLPLAVTPGGLPVGLQLIGQPRGEARLLQIAYQIEGILGLGSTPIDPVVRHLPTGT